MGMIGCFAAIDAAKEAEIRQNPALMEDFLYPDDDGEPEHSIDIDKAWHGIHFMLAGVADEAEGPLASAVLGGEPVGEEMGYGPARLLSPAEVKEVAAALEALPVEEFRTRFQPAAMTAADIYPAIIWERDGQEALDYVAVYYEELRAFYRATAARGDGAVLWLS